MKHKKRDFDIIPESDCIVDYFERRYNKGLYTLLLATGLPGTGKSSVCQRLAQLVSKRIHGEDKINEDDIVDSLLEFLGRLRKVKKPGEIIVIEEVSVLFPSRRAMAKENVAISRVLETCRKKRVILLANAPIFNSIDSHIRQLGHILIETLKIIKSQEVVISKAWKLQTNPHSGKTYRHSFTRDGRDVRLFFTRKPQSEVWEKYEEKKDKFMDDLYERLEKQTAEKNRKEDKKYGINKPKELEGYNKPPTENEMTIHYYRDILGLSNNETAKRTKKAPSTITKTYKRYKNKVKSPDYNNELVFKTNTPANNLISNSQDKKNKSEKNKK